MLTVYHSVVSGRTSLSLDAVKTKIEALDLVLEAKVFVLVLVLYLGNFETFC